MTIKQAYQRARRNYLRRVRNQEMQGYIVDIIPVPKKPTSASIRRLEKQTAKVIQSKSSFQSFLTGEQVDKPTRYMKAENKAFTQLSTEFQAEARRLGTTNVRLIESALSVQMFPVSAIDVIIDNFLNRIKDFAVSDDLKTNGYIVQELTTRILRIVYDGTEEDKRRLAYVLDKNPNILGDYKYFNVTQMDIDFNGLREAMNMAEDSEDYRQFIESLGIVESED